jgi:hypothetical protein
VGKIGNHVASVTKTQREPVEMLMTFCYEGKRDRRVMWHEDETGSNFCSVKLIRNRVGDLGKNVRQCPL